MLMNLYTIQQPQDFDPYTLKDIDTWC